jgi:hypothetical protein
MKRIVFILLLIVLIALAMISCDGLSNYQTGKAASVAAKEMNLNGDVYTIDPDGSCMYHFVFDSITNKLYCIKTMGLISPNVTSIDQCTKQKQNY